MLFIIDFDGTVAPADTVDDLLEKFADPEWKRIERAWVQGLINSQQCMASQIALVAAERPALETFFQSVIIDPAFPAFVREALTFADVAIVSDGLDYPIQQALQRLDIPPVPVFANRLRFTERGLNLSFPYGDAMCAVGSGVCKCAVARAVDGGRGLATVLIGDGRSDQCIARRADYVFAKGSLIKFCEAENIRCIPFTSFADVSTIVRGWDIRPRREAQFKESACPLTNL
jgi:2-hydroxy-3-keto-5-methylthiopentenyl-1-phosphate phosphatase